MSANNASTGAASASERDLVITQVFDAPRRLVFEAWTKPEHLTQWWGPKGFTLPVCEMNFRAGGTFHFVMRGPDSKNYPFQGAFLEIVEPERIAFHGTIQDDPGHKVWTTVTFDEREGKTKLTVNQTYSFVSDATRGAPEGWRQSLDRLRAHVEMKR